MPFAPCISKWIYAPPSNASSKNLTQTNKNMTHSLLVGHKGALKLLFRAKHNVLLFFYKIRVFVFLHSKCQLTATGSNLKL